MKVRERSASPMKMKVSEMAKRYRISKDAIYSWIRSGTVPESCLSRIGSSIRIETREFDRLVREGKLCKPRRRVARPAPGEVVAEDSNTARKASPMTFEHRFGADESHPYSPAMMAVIR